MRALKSRRSRILTGLAAIPALALTLTAGSCDDPGPTGQAAENASRQAGYVGLTKSQPAGKMSYSPTRETKNFWIKTWNQPGKLSYVYLQNAAGEVVGYYVLKGLPVSYCTSLVPPYQWVDMPGDGDSYGDTLAAGPSVDGTFSSGGDCTTKYGEDATTGSYIEFTVGNGQNVLLFDQPNPRFNLAQPLGPTTVEQAAAIPQPPAGAKP